MNGRWWILLLFVYVTLDFAAPLMPGAIYFEDGNLRVVTGAKCRTKPAIACVRAPLQEAHPVTGRPSVSLPSPRRIAVPDRSPRRTTAAHRVHQPVEPASTSPDDQ